ncbi:MAG: proline--tRNA ligase, partial [Clostridia bacterium]|nr:proline--tRNA ligase [Clostridia bacterium]
MKYVANGIYSQYMPLKRICRKIENIIREEMDALDGQEVQFPVVLPADLWKESGRYESVGGELLRFSDRNNAQMVLGMTHEEASVQLVREYGQTYSRYPFMIYQIQTKFRDEARPRAGMIRVREFTMKDAYSFHTSQEDLQEFYDRCLASYHKIFARAGIPETVCVQGDSGMMGGSISHEFMLVTPVGEDSLAICPECGYSANMETAENIVVNEDDSPMEELRMVHTPGAQTIEAVCTFLGSDVKKSCKAVVYQKDSDDGYVVVFVRGDMEVNETKLRNYLKSEIRPADITEECGLVAGYIGPYKITDNCQVLLDNSLKGIHNLVCGANVEEYHYSGLNIERDIEGAEYMDLSKIQEGGICPVCHKHTITLTRGIEVGNIFQLGTKYTKSMNMQYVDPDGNMQEPLMGCYGIGVGRLAASVCEAHHDEYGPIWPISIAPWQVHLCCLRSDDQEAKACADSLYKELQDNGIEVIYDDRKVRPGVMFSDADLLGVPIRIIVSPRNLKENCCEIVTRDKSVSLKAPVDTVLAEVKQLIGDQILSIVD